MVGCGLIKDLKTRYFSNVFLFCKGCCGLIKDLKTRYCLERAIENVVSKYKYEILMKLYQEDDYIKKELSEIKNVNSKDWYYLRGSWVQNNDLLLFIENSLKT